MTPNDKYQLLVHNFKTFYFFPLNKHRSKLLIQWYLFVCPSIHLSMHQSYVSELRPPSPQTNAVDTLGKADTQHGQVSARLDAEWGRSHS